jgi:hypothetical protein
MIRPNYDTLSGASKSDGATTNEDIDGRNASRGIAVAVGGV